MRYTRVTWVITRRVAWVEAHSNGRASGAATPLEMVFEPRLDQNCADGSLAFGKLCAWERELWHVGAAVVEDRPSGRAPWRTMSSPLENVSFIWINCEIRNDCISF